MEKVNGDPWHTPAIFMLKGRYRHWRDPTCCLGQQRLGLLLVQWLYASLLCPMLPASPACIQSGEGLDKAALWGWLSLCNYRQQGLSVEGE